MDEVLLERIQLLVIKYLDEGLSVTEREELDQFIASSSENRDAIAEFLDEGQLKVGIKEVFESRERLWKRIEWQLDTQKIIPIRRSLTKWITAAAVLLLFLGGYWWFSQKSPASPNPGIEVAKIQDIPAPASNWAMITLSDGRTVYLDSAANGTLLQENGIKVEKLGDGKIMYGHDAATPRSLVYNTLSNPRGSKVIDILLSDSTHVWLNAGSTIKYPVLFPEDGRRVVITGEAYFEVKTEKLKLKKEKVPFYVDANGSVTEVLGTHFNVNAYENVKVTLLEGSVRLTQNANAVMLKPGEAAAMSNGQLSVDKDVDLEQVMAWKNGLFAFKGTSLQEIMKEVGRWYDVEVLIEGNIGTVKFSGKFGRTLGLKEFLKILDETRIHYKLEGKNLTITP